MEPISIIAGLVIGGGLGVIAGGLFAGARVKEELTELRAWKASVLSGLNKASAARKAKAIALTNARHAEMRAKFGTAELV